MISWIAWNKSTFLILKRGLSIGDLHPSNQAMLCKWCWRFHNKDYALWSYVIRSIHRRYGGLNDISTIKSKSSQWYRIVKLEDELKKIDIHLPSIFKKIKGNGRDTRFWLDNWMRSLLKDAITLADTTLVRGSLKNFLDVVVQTAL
ncbi:hypothetical protein Tco_0242527, partial [Tanacetum coccineum]